MDWTEKNKLPGVVFVVILGTFDGVMLSLLLLFFLRLG